MTFPAVTRMSKSPSALVRVNPSVCAPPLLTRTPLSPWPEGVRTRPLITDTRLELRLFRAQSYQYPPALPFIKLLQLGVFLQGVFLNKKLVFLEESGEGRLRRFLVDDRLRRKDCGAVLTGGAGVRVTALRVLAVHQTVPVIVPAVTAAGLQLYRAVWPSPG